MCSCSSDNAYPAANGNQPPDYTLLVDTTPAPAAQALQVVTQHQQPTTTLSKHYPQQAQSRALNGAGYIPLTTRLMAKAKLVVRVRLYTE